MLQRLEGSPEVCHSLLFDFGGWFEFCFLETNSLTFKLALSQHHPPALYAEQGHRHVHPAVFLCFAEKGLFIYLFIFFGLFSVLDGGDVAWGFVVVLCCVVFCVIGSFSV